MTGRAFLASIATRRARLPGARGFTLLELIVVLILISIMAALSAPELAAMVRRAAVQKATGDFLGLTRLARSTASLKQKPVELTLNPETREIFLYPYTPRVKSSGIQAVDQLFEKNKDNTRQTDAQPIARLQWPERVRLDASKLRQKDGIFKLRFNPDGTSENVRLSFDENGLRVTLEVEAISGRARVIPNPEFGP